MPTLLDKVTPFITRTGAHGRDLLLFRHPFAGNQVPAGTVEPGELPALAALREAREETGLDGFSIEAHITTHINYPLEGWRVIGRITRGYARPDPTSWDWVEFGARVMVREHRRANGFTQITFSEPDRLPDPQYATFEITAWVPDDALADGWRRHFFHLTHPGDTPPQIAFTDGHRFAPFWAPLDDLPPIIAPQDEWIAVLRDYLARSDSMSDQG